MAAADALGTALAARALRYFTNPGGLLPMPEVVTFIPRISQTEWNAAAELARIVGMRLGLPVETLLMKVKDYGTLKEKGQEARHEAVSGAFVATPAARGRRILIVDDILTTSATAQAAATASRLAGAQQVVVAAAGKTKGG